MSRAHPRAQRLRRIAVAWLLSVGLAGVLGAAAAQAAAREHACCRNAPARAATPPAPCSSLLPLACCHGTALPAATHAASDLGGPMLATGSVAPAPDPGPALAVRVEAGPVPRASPLALSVVLRL